MTSENQTVLDNLLKDHPLTCQTHPVQVTPDELVHVAGSQEPVRDQPDERLRMLLTAGWLKIDYIDVTMSEAERPKYVATLQKNARTWLKQTETNSEDREQIRWVIEKTRSHESKQQIAQRVWLASVLYGLGHRGLKFDSEGQIQWTDGFTGRVGIAPDTALDLAWKQPDHKIYTASFRQPDGTITRGKGRQRWHTYRLTVDAAATPLFEHRSRVVQEKVALIVASETYATQPQLPRDFYGGDSFQQACIDAQDQHFDHILVLSPEHGVISLDDIVPSDISWDDMMERRVWDWQILASQRLGMYLCGESRPATPQPVVFHWWPWANPDSTYELTTFGRGFAVRILLDHLAQSSTRQSTKWPQITISEPRPGYDVGGYEDDLPLDFGSDDDLNEDELENMIFDIDHMMDLASELVEIVNIYVPPTGEVWELAPDEALLPIRLLSGSNMDIEDLMDLLTDITLLLEHPLPISLIINSSMVVSVLLQIAHSLVHRETEPVSELLEVFPENVLHQYVGTILQETNQEEQLCACLTLAEQLQLLSLAIPPLINDQLMIWMQTFLSAKLRQRLLNDLDEED